MFDQVVTGSSVVFFSGELDNDYFGSDANWENEMFDIFE
jgi:hypothetical protein